MAKKSTWGSKPEQLAKLLAIGRSNDGAQSAAQNGAGGEAGKTTLGGYEIIQKISQGTMGAVFKARQVSVDRIVALKVLPQRLAKNADFVERFLREARAAAKVNHPNIVQVIDSGHAGGYYYFAMEFVNGPNVGDVLSSSGRLAEDKALAIALDVARGLGCAHAAGIIHRDVKPDNILLTAEGMAKLSDLGIAREEAATDQRLTQAGVAMGTPAYISPEQARGLKDIDRRSDIYSFGGTLYHMLVGSPPYAGTSAVDVMSQHITAPPPDPRAKNPQVSAAAARIVMKAMAKDREQRYPDAASMAADIERVITSIGSSVRETLVAAPAVNPVMATTAGRAVTGRRRKRWIAIGSGIAALLLIGVGLALILGEGPTAPPPVSPAIPVAEKPAPKPKPSPDEATLASLRKWFKGHPEEYRAAIAEYEKSLADMKDPSARAQARADMDDIKLRQLRAAVDVFERLAQQAEAFANVGNYDEAIAMYNQVPERFADLLSERAKTASESLRTTAAARVRRAIEEADRLSKVGEPVEALAELKTLDKVRYAAATSEIQALRERLVAETQNVAETNRRRVLAAAEQELGHVLAAVEAAAASNDLAQAALLAQGAADSATLKPVASSVAALVNVGKVMPQVQAKKKAAAAAVFKRLAGQTITLETPKGTQAGRVKQVTDDTIVLEKTAMVDGQLKRIEIPVQISDLSEKTLAQYNVEWTPQTPDEAMAVAVIAAGTRNAEALEAALVRAGNHPLAAVYRDKLAELKSAVAAKPGLPPASDLADTLKQGLALHLAFDKDEGTKVTDLSGNGNNGTVVGAKYTLEGKRGGAYSLSGSQEHITIPNSDSLEIRDKVTLAVWVNLASLNPRGYGNEVGYIINKGDDLWWNPAFCIGYGKGGGETLFHVGNATDPQRGGGKSVGGTTKLEPGKWCHLAGVYDGATVKIYVNGNLEGTEQYTGQIRSDRAPVHLGGGKLFGVDWGNHFTVNGIVDEVRIYNRALSADEIKQVYNSAGGGPVLHLAFDKDEGAKVTDNSGKGNHGTVHGATWTPRGKVGGALDFDGRKDYIELGPSNLYKSKGQLSACAWVYVRGEVAIILSNYHGGNAYSGQFFFACGRDAELDVAFGQAPGAFLRYLSKKGTITRREWHHVAFSYDESRGNGAKIKLYVDGKETAASLIQGEGNGGPVLDIAENLRVMAHRDTPTGTLSDGLLDEVMIFDRALTAEEIKQIYNSAGGGPVMYLSFDKDEGTKATDKSGNGNHGIVNGAKWTAMGKVGGAYRFSGGTDHILVDSAALRKSSADSFSLAVWFYIEQFNPNDENTVFGIAAPRGVNDGAFSYRIGLGRPNGEGTDYALGFTPGTWCRDNSVAPLMLGLKEKRWYHVAGVYDKGDIRLYVDGVEKGRERYSLPPTAASTALVGCVGNSNGLFETRGFNGIIDEVMFFDRALSPEEIKRIYGSQPGAAAPPVHAIPR